MSKKLSPTIAELAIEDAPFLKKIIGKKSIAVIALVILIIFAVLFYEKNQTKVSTNSNTQQALQNASLIKEVGEKIQLPTGETPTIATVSDITKLANQPFFKNAQNGDKVLIFTNAKEAILYRQSIHKIIAVAPVNVNGEPQVNPQSTASAQTTPLPSASKTITKLRVVVLNSTKTAGLAKKGASLLNPNAADVIQTANSVGNYTTTTVSNVSKTQNITNDMLKNLVSPYTKITSTIIPLPKDEIVPQNADVVIILGSDFSTNY